MVMKIGNRKFFVAMASFILSALYIVACIFYRHLTEIAVPFFTCLGTIDGAFFAANIGEHAINKGAENVPDTNKPI